MRNTLKTIADFAEELNRHNLIVTADVRQPQAEIAAISYDSAAVQPGTLFVCKGARFQSRYLEEAVAAGAICAVAEKPYPDVTLENFIQVRDIRLAMAVIANVFHDWSWRQMKLIGVTGTKAKTTISQYIWSILNHDQTARRLPPAGICSTVGVNDGQTESMPINTTPETFELHEYLQRAVDNGVSLFVQEVSSQALKYERVGLLDFAYGVFTNFARDHISPAEHPDLEDYFASKLKLVQRADVAVICQDQPEFDRIRAAARNRVLTYGETAAADYYPDQIRQDGEWLTFTGHGRGLSLPLRIRTFGYINALNAMAAVAIAHDLGISPANIQAGLEKATVPGRMERLSSRDGSRVVIVDYAHNLSSYQALLKAIKREYPNHRTVFVYGCAGDKAYDRREQLGTFTGREVDLSVVTADDPGREGFAKIADEIIHHIELQNGDYLRIEDRETAIRTAILEAEPNSVIVTLGIGNHNFILIGDQDVPYKTDRLIAKEALQEYEQRL